MYAEILKKKTNDRSLFKLWNVVSNDVTEAHSITGSKLSKYDIAVAHCITAKHHIIL